jgi:hypothetical protein
MLTRDDIETLLALTSHVRNEMIGDEEVAAADRVERELTENSDVNAWRAEPSPTVG